jgi:DNA-binding NtrC family response regulator
MNAVEIVRPRISSPESVVLSPRLPASLIPGRGRELAPLPLDAAADRRLAIEASPPAPNRLRVGAFSLRQIVEGAVAQAEGDAIRRALGVSRGNKSQAARLLRTNYTTLHAKMRRYGIEAREFQG